MPVFEVKVFRRRPVNVGVIPPTLLYIGAVQISTESDE